MSERVCSRRWNAVSRIALVSLVSGLGAACSSDTMRLAQPFSNPFSSSERVASAQPQAETRASAASQVAAVPTAPVQSQALPPVQSAPVSRVASAPVTSSQGGWSASGGTRITVGQGDSLNAISQRYGVPTNAILAANGLSAQQVAPGTQIVIPVYNAAGQATQVAAAPAQPAPQTKFRLVEGPKPAPKVAEKSEEPKQRVRPGMIATAKKPERNAPQQVASVAPAPKAAPAQPVAAPKPVAVQPVQPVVAEKPAPQPAQQVAARTEPQPAKPVVQAQAPAPQPQAAPAPAPVAEPEQTGALGTDFRWPARGRVIAGFGANGGNEGINIAVPEGTPVKAAEAGTVTYAGSEVKGYGNLVLVRHDNGYVSAYAHNGSLSVKRGERVKRGQVIATSGQTGNVTSPQLHFELRKGSAPVDPLPYLNGG